MFEAVGHAVSRLIRIRYGAMLLPRGLRRGGWLELDDRDIEQLSRAAGSAPDRRDGAGDARTGRPARRDAPRPSADRHNTRAGGNRNASGGGGGSGGGRGRGPSTQPSPFERSADPGRANRDPGGPGGRARNTPASAGRNDQPPMRRERAEPRGGNEQPDPMKTAFGYIGADSFVRQRQAPGQSRGADGGGGNRSGGWPQRQSIWWRWRWPRWVPPWRPQSLKQGRGAEIGCAGREEQDDCVKSDHWPHANLGAPNFGGLVARPVNPTDARSAHRCHPFKDRIFRNIQSWPSNALCPSSSPMPLQKT